MFKLNTKRYLGNSVNAFMGLAVTTILATVAWGSQGLIQDRRVSLGEARQMASSLKVNPQFPITVNEAVVKELNRYLGTPDGREFIKMALARLENHQSLVERKLSEYGLPKELMSLPIMESGYENLPQSTHPFHSAGVWQFIPQTARNYGMRVDANVDERLNVEKETDAACRYLGSLNLRFQNWELVVLAYNAGENLVQQGVTKTGSKNAWTLIDQGFTGDTGYLPKMIASLLIMNNPALLD